MANNTDNNSPLVKLAVAILDDPHGITTEAWEALTEVFKQQYGTRPPPPLVPKLIKAILVLSDGGDDRVYLPEGWNDENSG